MDRYDQHTGRVLVEALVAVKHLERAGNGPQEAKCYHECLRICAERWCQNQRAMDILLTRCDVLRTTLPVSMEDAATLAGLMMSVNLLLLPANQIRPFDIYCVPYIPPTAEREQTYKDWADRYRDEVDDVSAMYKTMAEKIDEYMAKRPKYHKPLN